MIGLAAHAAASNVAHDMIVWAVCYYRLDLCTRTLLARDCIASFHILVLANVDFDFGVAPRSTQMNLPVLAGRSVADVIGPKLAEVVGMVCLRLVTVAGTAEPEQEFGGPDSHCLQEGIHYRVVFHHGDLVAIVPLEYTLGPVGRSRLVVDGRRIRHGCGGPWGLNFETRSLGRCIREGLMRS